MFWWTQEPACASIGKLESLRSLRISTCVGLQQLPSSIGALTNLSKLYLENLEIKEPPESIHLLKGLWLHQCVCSWAAGNLILLLCRGPTISYYPAIFWYPCPVPLRVYESVLVMYFWFVWFVRVWCIFAWACMLSLFGLLKFTCAWV